MSSFDVVTVVVQPDGGSTPAAAKQSVAVTVDCPVPWGVRVLATEMSQVTSNPAPVGKPGGSHWATTGAWLAALVTAAEATGGAVTVPVTKGTRDATPVSPVIAWIAMGVVCGSIVVGVDAADWPGGVVTTTLFAVVAGGSLTTKAPAAGIVAPGVAAGVENVRTWAAEGVLVNGVVAGVAAGGVLAPNALPGNPPKLNIENAARDTMPIRQALRCGIRGDGSVGSVASWPCWLSLSVPVPSIFIWGFMFSVRSVFVPIGAT
jgi:hypothetical protein